jgi:tetratricopeptide (TPR) repeat protein
MRNWQWYWGVTLAASLALTAGAVAQQAQHEQTQKEQTQKQATPGSSSPFDPCTGNGLPPSSQMAPFAPGSPNNMNPPAPKKVTASVTCSHGKCKPTHVSQYEQQQEMNSAAGAGLPLSPGSTPTGKKNAAKEENAFPLAKSEAAQAAREKANEQAPQPQGNYSSSDQRLPGVNALGNGPAVNDFEEQHPAFDPELARKDDKVGRFYLRSGDWAGAYGRYQQAAQVDPQDLHAVIGLAMAADHLGKREEAIRNYKLYLDVMPNGKHSKDALRALKRLARKQ